MTDVTKFSVGGQKLHLSPILDLYNGEIVTYEMARRPLFNMIDAMLRRAFARLGPRDRPGLAYRMPVYREALKRQEVTQSMARRGTASTMPLWRGFRDT